MITSIAVAIWLVSAASSSYAQWAQWSPRPEPTVEQLYGWTPLWDDRAKRTLKPGESLEIPPGRLSVLRVQFAQPKLASYVGISRRFDAPPSSSAHVPIAPLRLRDGDWLVFSPMHQRVPLELTYSGKAKVPLEFTVQRLEQSETRYYWVWWAQRLLEWVEAGGRGEPPQGLAIPGRRGVVQEAQLVSELTKLVAAAGGTDDEIRAARHLGRVRLLRAIEMRREPSAGYYTSEDLLAAHNDPLAGVSVRADTRDLGEAGVLGERNTLEIEVEGPAQVHLGLRAFKEAARPDASTDYSLEVVEDGETVHRDDFSSRAGKYEVDTPAGDTLSSDKSSGDTPSSDTPASDKPAGDTVSSDTPASDTPSGDDSQLIVDRAADGRVFATDQRGRVLGWRRQTRWWVPPGKHRYQLRVSGADVALDGRIYRPKQLVEDALERRWDASWHVVQAEDLLAQNKGDQEDKGDQNQVSNRLLRIERAALVQDHRAIRTFTGRYRQALAGADHPGVRTWFAWHRLESVGSNAAAAALPSAEHARAMAANPDVAETLRRRFAFTLAELHLERGEPNRALELMELFEEREDSLEQVLLRARAEMEGGENRWQRWRAVSQLYESWLERPTSEPIQETLQEYWWSQTYWRELTPRPEGQTPRVDLAEAVPAETGEVFVDEVSDLSRVWYRVVPGKPYEFRIKQAFDRPNRLARVRLALEGESGPGFHRLEWNDQTLTSLRLGTRQTLTFAAKAKASHILRVPESDQAGQSDELEDTAVFVDQPPLDGLSLDAGDVVREQTYWRATADDPPTFSLPAVGTTRFVRVAVRGQAVSGQHGETGKLDDWLRCNFGDGRQRVVPVRWQPAPEGGADRAVRFLLEVPASARQLTLRPRDESLLVSLDMRAGKLPELPEDQRIEVAVELPADQERLDALRHLSNQLAEASAVERVELLIKRAKILMSLARNRLARVDLERAIGLVPATHPLFEQARLLRRSVLERLSSKWFELEEDWLADAANMAPLDLAAQVVSTAEGAEALETCGLAQWATGSSATGPCRRARLFFALADAEGDNDAQIAALQDLLERWPSSSANPWHVHRLLAERLLDQAVGGGEQASAAATDAYGHARRAAELFPVSSVRSVWYDALGHTRWTTLTSLSGGIRSAFASFEPTREVENAADFDLAVIDDPIDEQVGYALLGVNWPPSHALQMYQDSRRSLSFEAQRSGELVLRRICVDLRPDLQGSGPAEPCRIFGELHRDDGQAVAAEGSRGAVGSQEVATTRWKVRQGVEYRLSIERTDDVSGRLAYAYTTVSYPDQGAGPRVSPVVQRRSRRVRVLTPSDPAATVLLGPTYLRLDARSLSTLGAEAVNITVEHLDSGETSERLVELSDNEQAGAFLAAEELTRARRAEMWLSRAGPYRIVIEAQGGLAAVRMQARVHDSTGLAARAGSTEAVPEDEQAEDEDARAESNSRASESGPGDDGFDLDLALDPVRAPHLARFGRRDLLEEEAFAATPFLSMAWSARDFEISSESPTSSDAGSRLEVLGGAYAAFDEPRLWLRAQGGLRLEFETPMVLTAGASADWRPDWWRLRVQPKASIYTQTSGQAFYSGRGELKVARSFGVADSLWWVHNLRAKGRLQADDALARAAGRLSPRIYSSYAEAHPVTWDYLSLLWWRPFLNLIGYGYVQPVLNPDLSLDKLRMRAVGRTMVETTRLELGYAFTWYVDDQWRANTFLRHDLELSGRLYYWVMGEQLLSLDAFAQGSLYDFRSNDRFELSFGLQASYTFANRAHTGQLPPTELTFEELIEPRYFRD